MAKNSINEICQMPVTLNTDIPLVENQNENENRLIASNEQIHHKIRSTTSGNYKKKVFLCAARLGKSPKIMCRCILIATTHDSHRFSNIHRPLNWIANANHNHNWFD